MRSVVLGQMPKVAALIPMGWVFLKTIGGRGGGRRGAGGGEKCGGAGGGRL